MSVSERELADARAEIATLKAILREAIWAVGGLAVEGVSTAFLAQLPAEIAARMDALKAQVTRLQADSTAEVLKHREHRAMLERARDKFEAELDDAKIALAALNAGIARFRAWLDDYSDVEDGKGDNPADVTPNWAMRCEMELDAALAGKGVNRG